MHIKNKYLKRIVSIFLIVTLTMSVLTGCSSKKKDDTNTGGSDSVTEENNHVNNQELVNLPLDTVMLTVNDTKYTLADVMYYIYYAEQEGEFRAIEMANQNQIDFWNDRLEEGSDDTGVDVVRRLTMDMAQRYCILANFAKEAGYKCNTEEQENNKQMAKNIVEAMSPDYLERTGFTEEKLLQSLETAKMVYNYISDQSELQKVKQADAEAKLNKAEYAQKQLEYIFISTTYNDDKGEEQRYSVEEISGIMKKARSILNDLEGGMSMQKAYEKAGGEADTQIVYNEEAFYESYINANENFKYAISTVNEGELYKNLVETDDGYYIFRLISDNATDAYDDALADELNTLKKDAFYASYEKSIKDFNIVQNQEAWDKIAFRNYAYPKNESSEEVSQIHDEDLFEKSDLTGGTENVQPDNGAEGDDGSVG